MDMIKRTLEDTIKRYRKKGFINIIYGPRQVGKTVLLQKIIKDKDKKDYIWFNGDTFESQEALSTNSQVVLTNLVKNKKVIVIDEAQRIKNIGLSLKILIDSFPDKQFYVSGSSSLMLSAGVKESLTGRNITFKLYPLSTEEISSYLEEHQKKANLENQLIYGGYPHLTTLSTPKEKEDYLKMIVEDYLFKDVLMLKDLGKPDILRKLVALLSFQIGSQVSLNELAQSLVVDVKTVSNYLSLLKESFVIFEVYSFSRNLRKELIKSKKYYFWDLGIRNAVISQFLSLDSRTDIGKLWENFLVVERLKKQEYNREFVNHYFWRTYEGSEIDWIEEKDAKIRAFEFKWKGKSKTPKSFKKKYKEEVATVNKDNYFSFIAS